MKRRNLVFEEFATKFLGKKVRMRWSTVLTAAAAVVPNATTTHEREVQIKGDTSILEPQDVCIGTITSVPRSTKRQVFEVSLDGMGVQLLVFRRGIIQAAMASYNAAASASASAAANVSPPHEESQQHQQQHHQPYLLNGSAHFETTSFFHNGYDGENDAVMALPSSSSGGSLAAAPMTFPADFLMGFEEQLSSGSEDEAGEEEEKNPIDPLDVLQSDFSTDTQNKRRTKRRTSSSSSSTSSSESCEDSEDPEEKEENQEEEDKEEEEKLLTHLNNLTFVEFPERSPQVEELITHDGLAQLTWNSTSEAHDNDQQQQDDDLSQSSSRDMYGGDPCVLLQEAAIRTPLTVFQTLWPRGLWETIAKESERFRLQRGWRHISPITTEDVIAFAALLMVRHLLPWSARLRQRWSRNEERGGCCVFLFVPSPFVFYLCFVCADWCACCFLLGFLS